MVWGYTKPGNAYFTACRLRTAEIAEAKRVLFERSAGHAEGVTLGGDFRHDSWKLLPAAGLQPSPRGAAVLPKRRSPHLR